MERVDVCIVGGGIAGASIAYHLAPHARVVLLEAEPQVGYHSTGRSAALYAPQYGSPLIRLLTAAAGPFLRAPPQGFSDVPILSERGSLVIGRNDQRATLAALESLAAASGQLLARLSATETLALVPRLRPASVDWGILDTTAMDVDVDALLQGLLRGARRHGATISTSRQAVALERAGSTWRVRTGSLELSASVVVNAAGAWADTLAGLAGIEPLGLVPHRRTAFTFEVPAGVEVGRWPNVIDADETFYFKADAGRLLGSLAEEVPSPPCDAQPDDVDVAVAVDRIEGVIDFPIARVVRAWTGLRVFGPDRDPVSGFEPSAPGFYWQAGLGGYGIQTSTAFGAFAASVVLGQPLPDAIAARGLEPAQLAPARLRR